MPRHGGPRPGAGRKPTLPEGQRSCLIRIVIHREEEAAVAALSPRERAEAMVEYARRKTDDA